MLMFRLLVTGVFHEILIGHAKGSRVLKVFNIQLSYTTSTDGCSMKGAPIVVLGQDALGGTLSYSKEITLPISLPVTIQNSEVQIARLIAIFNTEQGICLMIPNFKRAPLLSPFLRSAFSPFLNKSAFSQICNMSGAMSKRMEGKTVVITGASSGIGRSTAKEFARTSPRSLKLVITARRLDALQKLAAEIEEEVGQGVQVLPVKLDVSKADEVKSFVDSLPPEFRDINVLVNNAGLVKGVAKAPDILPEDIDVMMNTNVTGLIHMTQAVLPIFKKRGDGGQGDIINIGSIAGREGYPGGSIYCATKAAVRTFTDALRRELIATRIRVMNVDPGQVETEFSVVRFYGDKQKADAVYQGCEPLTPDDIAEVVVFNAGRRENVVIADSLIFPNHQVRTPAPFDDQPIVLDAYRWLGCCDGHASEILILPLRTPYPRGATSAA